jgi:hypothetical protein
MHRLQKQPPEATGSGHNEQVLTIGQLGHQSGQQGRSTYVRSDPDSQRHVRHAYTPGLVYGLHDGFELLAELGGSLGR